MHMCVKTYGSEVWNRGMERILQTGMERGYGTGVWNGCGPGPCSRPYNLTCTHMGLSQNRVPPNSNGLSSCASLKSIEMAICGYPYFQTNHDKPIFSFDLPVSHEEIATKMLDFFGVHQEKQQRCYGKPWCAQRRHGAMTGLTAWVIEVQILEQCHSVFWEPKHVDEKSEPGE